MQLSAVDSMGVCTTNHYALWVIRLCKFSRREQSFTYQVELAGLVQLLADDVRPRPSWLLPV